MTAPAAEQYIGAKAKQYNTACGRAILECLGAEQCDSTSSRAIHRGQSKAIQYCLRQGNTIAHLGTALRQCKRQNGALRQQVYECGLTKAILQARVAPRCVRSVCMRSSIHFFHVFVCRSLIIARATARDAPVLDFVAHLESRAFAYFQCVCYWFHFVRVLALWSH